MQLQTLLQTLWTFRHTADMTNACQMVVGNHRGEPSNVTESGQVGRQVTNAQDLNPANIQSNIFEFPEIVPGGLLAIVFGLSLLSSWFTKNPNEIFFIPSRQGLPCQAKPAKGLYTFWGG